MKDGLPVFCQKGINQSVEEGMPTNTEQKDLESEDNIAEEENTDQEAEDATDDESSSEADVGGDADQLDSSGIALVRQLHEITVLPKPKKV